MQTWACERSTFYVDFEIWKLVKELWEFFSVVPGESGCFTVGMLNSFINWQLPHSVFLSRLVFLILNCSDFWGIRFSLKHCRTHLLIEAYLSRVLYWCILRIVFKSGLFLVLNKKKGILAEIGSDSVKTNRSIVLNVVVM